MLGTMHFLLTALLLTFLSQVQTVQIIWDNDVSIDNNELDDMEFGKGDEARMPNWFFIFPGTKWCGAGNIAENDEDLGLFAETDKCCRTHDHCDDIIEGFQTEHGLTNPAFYTRLNCECDKEFYKCLKKDKSKPSRQIGHIYFTGLGTKCFRKEYPVTKCTRYTYIPTKKCVAYEYDETKEKVYQWFDVPNF